MAQSGFAKLDPREEHFRIPSHREGLSLFLRYLPALQEAQAHKNVVLYVHGGTFPSGLSIAHRFDGVSWRDELAASGFHCCVRLSDPYPEISESAEKHPPLGRADDASRQLEQAVRFICAHHRVSRISLIAHSWGSIFDVPGVGGSPSPWLPYRPSTLARLSAQLLEQLGHAQVDVLGLSWGGALAQQFAFQQGKRCRRLVQRPRPAT